MQKNVVFDTSVAIKWFFPEKGKALSEKLKTQHISGKINLVTRDLFLYELTSAFRNSKQKIDVTDFGKAINILMALKVDAYAIEWNELSEIFELSKKLDISAYDCSFILLAQKLKASLYTADRKLFDRGRKVVKIFLV